MKIILLSMAFVTALLFNSFSTTYQQEEEILKLTLEMEKITKLLLESPENEAAGLLIVTNGELSTELDLRKFGQAVELVQDKTDIKNERPYMAMESFKIKENSAVLKFTYTGYSIKIKFGKEDEKWMARSYRLYGNGRLAFENDF